MNPKNSKQIKYMLFDMMLVLKNRANMLGASYQESFRGVPYVAVAAGLHRYIFVYFKKTK